MYRPQMIIMLSGLLLIIFGVGAVGFQSYNEIIAQQHSYAPSRSNDLFVKPNQLQVTTRFPGIEMILIGSILEIVGYVGTRPWNFDKNSK